VTILIFLQYYAPGYRAGGPIRAIAEMVSELGREYDFRIVTRDRDLGSSTPYSGIEADTWTRCGAAQVFYSSGRLSYRTILRLVREIRPDTIYLNGSFDPRFSLKPLLLYRLGLLGRGTVVIAPRGQFRCSALAVKRPKKAVFLAAAKLLRLYRDVIWHATSSDEQSDVHLRLGPGHEVFVAPPISGGGPAPSRRPKVAGSLRVIYLSRICPIKNLKGAIEILAGLKGKIELTILGPIEDEAYWAECREALRSVPGNVAALYKGAVRRDDVPEALFEHDVLLLPTRGENYGHVIIEALFAGCPVVVSDQTPWQGLEASGAGSAIPLDDTAGFRRALERYVAMDEAEFARCSENARRYACDHADRERAAQAHREIFRRALASSDRRNSRRHPVQSEAG
jgi:glycosyltransferase involved in cell wall biosynthesis